MDVKPLHSLLFHSSILLLSLHVTVTFFFSFFFFSFCFLLLLLILVLFAWFVILSHSTMLNLIFFFSF